MCIRWKIDIIDHIENIILHHWILKRNTRKWWIRRDLCCILEDKMYQCIFWSDLERYLAVECQSLFAKKDIGMNMELIDIVWTLTITNDVRWLLFWSDSWLGSITIRTCSLGIPWFCQLKFNILKMTIDLDGFYRLISNKRWQSTYVKFD